MSQDYRTPPKEPTWHEDPTDSELKLFDELYTQLLNKYSYDKHGEDFIVQGANRALIARRKFLGRK